MAKAQGIRSTKSSPSKVNGNWTHLISVEHVGLIWFVLDFSGSSSMTKGYHYATRFGHCNVVARNHNSTLISWIDAHRRVMLCAAQRIDRCPREAVGCVETQARVGDVSGESGDRTCNAARFKRSALHGDVAQVFFAVPDALGRCGTQRRNTDICSIADIGWLWNIRRSACIIVCLYLFS